MAKARHILKELVLERLPAIDIVVFGRSGIGKSTLVEAITHVDMLPSSPIDHVTEVLTEVTVEIEPLKFRFWDTKGIDSWSDIDAIDNLFNEIIAREMKPLFVIYCATMNGRVDSDIVAGILARFRMLHVPICYVITNIYAANSE